MSAPEQRDPKARAHSALVLALADARNERDEARAVARQLAFVACELEALAIVDDAVLSLLPSKLGVLLGKIASWGEPCGIFETIPTREQVREAIEKAIEDGTLDGPWRGET